jgi:hypothetical protein
MSIPLFSWLTVCCALIYKRTIGNILPVHMKY